MAISPMLATSQLNLGKCRKIIVVSQLHKVVSQLLLVPGCLNNTPKLTLLNIP